MCPFDLVSSSEHLRSKNRMYPNIYFEVRNYQITKRIDTVLAKSVSIRIGVSIYLPSPKVYTNTSTNLSTS